MLEIGQDLQQGRYRIRAHLNQGGMGTVYLATDRNLSERLVAIKENSDTLAGAQAQFLHEAVLLARLTHPNLPRVTDHFIEPSGRQYLVMDYVSGADLKEILHKRQAPLPEADVLAWIGQVMDALAYMHSWSDSETGQPSPIIHRDIKPSNIKLTPDGRIVLVDFGVAKYQTGIGTQIGARAITPGYSPVEQYTGGTDVRSDVYALGATLYTLLTNTKPPDSPAIAGGKPLPAPRKLNLQVSRNTERVILRAMQVQAADRFSNIQAMRAALDGRQLLNFGTDRRTSLPPRPIQRANRPAQQSHTWVWIGIIAFIALFAFAITAASMLPTILHRWGFATVTQRAVGIGTVTTTVPATLHSASTPVAMLATTLTTSLATIPAKPRPEATPTITDQVQAAGAVTVTALTTNTPSVPATPTATRTPRSTATSTVTATATPTPSATPSVTTTSTLLPTTTSTATPRATVTPVPTNTPTITPAPTATATATPRPTNTATASPSPLPTATTTTTPTNSPTSTPTQPPATFTPTPGTPLAGATRINPLDRATYVYVPAGQFTMGSTDKEEEKPPHTVDLNDFWIMQTEVTNAAYARCVTAGACTPPNNQRWNDATYAQYPVANINWNQANQYATWAGGRLPTEAEWEKAARGDDGRLYPWGEQAISDERLNYNNVQRDTMPVGSYPAGAGPYGTLDMAGNLEEWVADWYGDTYYASAPAQNPLGPDTGIFRVVRGGSFNNNRVDVRTTARGKAVPNTRVPSVGFRVVVAGS